jgi:hypothetical protein
MEDSGSCIPACGAWCFAHRNIVPNSMDGLRLTDEQKGVVMLIGMNDAVAAAVL